MAPVMEAEETGGHDEFFEKLRAFHAQRGHVLNGHLLQHES